MTSTEANKILGAIEETGRSIQKLRTAIEVSRSRVSGLLDEVREMGVKLPKKPAEITPSYVYACVSEIRKESERRQKAVEAVVGDISLAIKEADRKIEEADAAADSAREDG